MICAMTVRRLKAGSYDDFRKAWQPDPWPEALVRVEIMRNQDDPDEVTSIGWLDLTLDELDALRDDPDFMAAEARRIARIAPHEEAVLVNAIYEVAEEVLPPGA